MTERFKLYLGDCLEVLRTLPDNSVDSIVTDPPYGLSKEPDMAEVLRHWMAGDDYQHKGGGFMGKSWDSFVPGPSVWKECLRVLKPGGHLLAFFGTRTQDMGTLAIRLAGFEIRDSIAWVYGSGFPKSLNVAKAIESGGGRPEDIRRMQMGEGYEPSGRGRVNYDHGAGSNMDSGASDWQPATDAARQWQGWGTALKPALEPITVARKPLIGTVAANVLAHRTGALNIDGCRVPGEPEAPGSTPATVNGNGRTLGAMTRAAYAVPSGRWPANLIHDGSDEVVALFPQSSGGAWPANGAQFGMAGGERKQRGERTEMADTGSAARFFYCAKASRKDRHEGLDDPGAQFKRGTTLRKVENTATTGNNHPTVKPTDLTAYLCRLVTPPSGVVLDPFTGSGSTGKAAMREGFRFIGCELSPEYLAIARVRITHQLEAEIMRTIYCTPFDDKTKQSTGPSTDSGFASIAEVVESMGGEFLSCSDRAVVYPGLMFSDYVLRVES